MRLALTFALLLTPLGVHAETPGVTVAFEIGQRDLIPEGIDYDPDSGAFFVSSVYRAKIVRIGDDGGAVDFIGEREHGFFGGVGVRVDGRRGLLWAASAMGYQTRGFTKEQDGRSALFAFELADGSLTGKWTLDDGESHLLNDVVVAQDGSVYVTDTLTATIYATDGESSLAKWVTSEELPYPNGLCLGESEKILYVAHEGGVSAIERATRSIRRLRNPDGARLDAIDGLYCVDGALVAVQNHRGLERVARFPFVGPAEVGEPEILLEGDPRLHIPTTLAVVGEDGFLIANSYLDAFDREKGIHPTSELSDPIVLRIPLVKRGAS